MVTPPLRAVCFDVYNTLLKVGPPPADAARQWQQLLKRFGLETMPDLARFQQGNETATVRHHVRARTIGICHPEIYWPQVVNHAWPVTEQLSSQEMDDFLFEHAKLVRTTVLNDGVAPLLRNLRTRHVLAGIVSNAQPYTVRELKQALETQGLSLDCFSTEACFWSFESGFSKPDPHVFRWLESRLRRLAIRPSEALIVGDRLDNDILPARAQGYQTWLMGTSESHPPADGSGSLQDLLKTIDSTVNLAP